VKTGEDLVKRSCPAESFALQVREANSSLSRCKLVQHSQRLYIRSSKFPPRPGTQAKTNRQELPTGYKAKPRELALALAVARQVDGALILGNFDWEPWLPEKQKTPVTIAQWLERLERDYWQRREKNFKAQTTWQKSYQDYFDRLPLEQPLSEEVLKEVLIENWKACTRSRQAASIAYGMLAAFAGLERRELAELGKGYKSPKKTSQNLLRDERIIIQLEQCKNQSWRNAAALQAIFGLRNHEIFKCDFSRVEENVVYVLPDTKTEERVCFGCPVAWIKRFGLHPGMELPKVRIEGRSNRAIGEAVTKAYKRYGLSHPGAFRDAYALRLDFHHDERTTPLSTKASWMGHSVAVHDGHYMAARDELDHEMMFAKMQQG
jgi:hypothetical protein